MFDDEVLSLSLPFPNTTTTTTTVLPFLFNQVELPPPPNKVLANQHGHTRQIYYRRLRRIMTLLLSKSGELECCQSLLKCSNIWAGYLNLFCLEVHLHFKFLFLLPLLDGQTADHLQQAFCYYSRDDILTVMCSAWGIIRGGRRLASMLLWCLHSAKLHAMLPLLESCLGNPGQSLTNARGPYLCDASRYLTFTFPG
ncbi:hypothetical protein NC652_018244 [Populus alba x Populus x berolinensis]|nr:hypothetical protein NC652_018244 [Populus alba x Populus x berolinensis]